MSLPKIIYGWKSEDCDDCIDGVVNEIDVEEGRTYGIYELKEKKKMVFERKPMKVK